jgi:hypothetical protein
MGIKKRRILRRFQIASKKSYFKMTVILNENLISPNFTYLFKVHFVTNASLHFLNLLKMLRF